MPRLRSSRRRFLQASAATAAADYRAGQANLSPFAAFQCFGEVNIDASSGTLTVDLRNLNGMSVFSRSLVPRVG